MREDNIKMLRDTLEIMEQGYYVADGKRVELKLTSEQMREIDVYLPRDIQAICADKNFQKARAGGHMDVGCFNIDSFSLARKRAAEAEHLAEAEAKPVLVLNLANPVNPGGGVRRGAKAQEEDLCRKSSLLLSLETGKAVEYYNYNKSLHTYMGSDALMITPQVEIIRDEGGKLLPESVVVAVMTCAAPMLRKGMEGLTEQEYRKMVYGRIRGMLKAAAYLGYQFLILGAFGCGAFANDARVISDLFYKAIKEFDFAGGRAEDYFRSIDFAVMDHSASQYNFREFSRNFQDFMVSEDR